MKNLIIISGDLAAGKSTLAFSLGKKLSYIVITKDSLKEIACDVFSYSNREENQKLSKVSMDNMVYFLNRVAIANQDVILEANFRNEDMQRISKIAEEYNYNVVLLFLYGDYKILYDRFLLRSLNRHKAHLSMGLQNDFNKYIEYIDMLRSQDLIYKINKIDTSKLDENQTLEESLKIFKVYGIQ